MINRPSPIDPIFTRHRITLILILFVLVPFLLALPHLIQDINSAGDLWQWYLQFEMHPECPHCL
jgi:hypothetical protein